MRKRWAKAYVLHSNPAAGRIIKELGLSGATEHALLVWIMMFNSHLGGHPADGRPAGLSAGRRDRLFECAHGQILIARS